MLIQVEDKNGKVFTNDMSQKDAIIEMHFCTSYTQVVVQEEVESEDGHITYPTRNIIIPTEKDDLESAIDFMKVSEDEIGEWYKERTLEDWLR